MVLRSALIGVVFLGVLSVLGARTARADFSIIPVTISLTPEKATELLTLHNPGAQTVRLQLSVYNWDQRPDGQFKLTPTDDLVFYPPIVTIEPREDRIVRVGAAVPFGEAEKTYRVLAEELPPPPEPAAPGAAKQVRSRVVVLARVYLPVFLLPSAVVHAESITATGIQNGRLSFRLKNDGNLHVIAGGPKVDGFGAGGKLAFHRQTLRGSYLLASEYLDYQFDIPNPECREIHKLAIEVPVTKPVGEFDFEGENLKAELNVTPERCGSAVAAGAKNP